MFVRNRCVFALDTPVAVAASCREYLLRGWCFPEDRTESPTLFIRIDNAEWEAVHGFVRNDVAEHFADPSIRECGFVLRFQASKSVSAVALLCRLHGLEFPLMSEIPLAHSDESNNGSTYQQWIAKQEASLFWAEEEVVHRIAALEYRPLISIILPTFNTPSYFLSRCLESIFGQTYKNWQLCIVDDQSSDECVWQTLQTYAAKDSRVHLQRSAKQGGISAASNLAISAATGQFLVLLDHDDELHPYALMEVARTLNEEDCDLLYSDEDKIDDSGLRTQPAFKPDFDPDVFLSFNYLGHLLAIRRELVDSIGGFRSSCDGAQDWDLLIRAVERIGPSRVRHIRKPLYHWRMHEASTAQNLDAKPYVAKAWARVLKEHVSRTGKPAEVTEGLFYGSMRLRYKAPQEKSVAVFIRPQDGAFQAAIVRQNIGSRQLYLYHVVEGSVFEFPIEGHAPFGAVANGNGNHGSSIRSLCSLTEVHGDVFLFLNAPLESLNHLFFEELVAQCLRPECGLVTGISLDPRNRTVATGLVDAGEKGMVDPYRGLQYPNHGYMSQLSVVRSLDTCGEMFFAMRREHLAAVGGLGAVSSSHMSRFCQTLSRHAAGNGLSILFTPYAVATFSADGKIGTDICSALDGKRRSKFNPRLLEIDALKLTTGSLGGRL